MSGHLELSSTARIVAESPAQAVAQQLAQVLRRSTGFDLPIVDPPAEGGDIVLELSADLATLGSEGYRLEVLADQATIRASTAAGLFYGTTTLRQLLPPEVESASVQSGVVWRLQCVQIEDAPQFAWRGMSMDVARHFYGVDDVKRLIDLASYHKLNRFHLHLTDDQGWRIEIKSWPELAAHGGSTEVGGGAGGFFTQDEYKDLVAYADARFVTLIPEIDMPGHTQAALASYGILNPDGNPKPLYTGTAVGISSLNFDDPDTLLFADDVLREVSGLTTGPYLHVGGDEAPNTDSAKYRTFFKAVDGIAQKYGKILVGWCEIGESPLRAGTTIQDWHPNCTGSSQGANAGMKVVLSPASNAYLDMKYTSSTPYGHTWAGLVEVQKAYEWPLAVPGVPSTAIVGIESALWTEFITNRAEADYMVFPRLCGHAELSWSPAGRTFAEYRIRLAHHGKRLTALGVGFYKSPQVAWEQ
jgi:hexosaminidase